MTPFSQLSQAIQNAIAGMPQAAGVSIVQWDSQNISIEIQKAVGSIGMLALLGVPSFKNKDAKLSNVVNADLLISILLREVPTLWRRSSNNNPIHCSDLGQAIAPALQGLVVPGFEDLRVLNGYSVGNFADVSETKNPVIFQDYLLQIETMQIFSAS